MMTIEEAKKIWEDAVYALNDALNRFGMEKRFDMVQVYDNEYAVSEDILDYWDKACLAGAVYEMLSF